MEKAVRREIHKLHAFVRFRTVEHEGGTHYVGWFEPDFGCLDHPLLPLKARLSATAAGSGLGQSCGPPAT